MIFLYNLFIFFYHAAVQIAALWNGKAKLWVQGRKNWRLHLKNHLSGEQPVVWVHASSAGEFEQAKPVIESIKSHFPNYRILISFFSPSGYKVARKYSFADCITYLPLDTRKNATDFMNLVKPVLVVFSKYDFWYYHLKTASEEAIPLLLISSIFRKEQAFFNWYGGFYRRMLRFFTHLFVQDEASIHLLKQYGISQCSISGDTRFDRVTAITKNFIPVPFIEAFKGVKDLIVAGSTWPDDEQLLVNYIDNTAQNCKLLIAPHEIAPENIKQIAALFKGSLLYSECKNAFTDSSASENNNPALLQKLSNARVLIIDNVGMLSRLYYYATVCYIGGGFTKDGVHNVLEAAVYGKPVVQGPNYQKYQEAKDLVERGGAFPVANNNELNRVMHQLFKDASYYHAAAGTAGAYVQEKRGATEIILKYIQENRLLTN